MDWGLPGTAGTLSQRVCWAPWLDSPLDPGADGPDPGPRLFLDSSFRLNPEPEPRPSSASGPTRLSPGPGLSLSRLSPDPDHFDSSLSKRACLCPQRGAQSRLPGQSPRRMVQLELTASGGLGSKSSKAQGAGPSGEPTTQGEGSCWDGDRGQSPSAGPKVRLTEPSARLAGRGRQEARGLGGGREGSVPVRTDRAWTASLHPGPGGLGLGNK